LLASLASLAMSSAYFSVGILSLLLEGISRTAFYGVYLRRPQQSTCRSCHSKVKRLSSPIILFGE
jgi:hypothetical protein